MLPRREAGHRWVEKSGSMSPQASTMGSVCLYALLVGMTQFQLDGLSLMPFPFPVCFYDWFLFYILIHIIHIAYTSYALLYSSASSSVSNLVTVGIIDPCIFISPCLNGFSSSPAKQETTLRTVCVYKSNMQICKLGPMWWEILAVLQRAVGAVVGHLGGKVWQPVCEWVGAGTGTVSAASQVALEVSSHSSSSEAFGRKAATMWEFPTQALADGAWGIAS